jgi:hypothetical protein
MLQDIRVCGAQLTSELKVICGYTAALRILIGLSIEFVGIAQISYIGVASVKCFKSTIDADYG